MIGYSIFKKFRYLTPLLFLTACAQKPTTFTATPNEIRQHIQSSSAPLTVVHLWATWCDPCREEFPELVKVQHAFAPKGMELILISADEPADIEHVKIFLEKQNMPIGSLISTELNQQFIEMISPSWAGSLPATFFFVEGKPVKEWEGKRSYEAYAQTIEALLNP